MLRRAFTPLSPSSGRLHTARRRRARSCCSVTVTNGTQFTDTTGAVVHAHGGEVIKVRSYDYSFRETATPTTPVNTKTALSLAAAR